MRHPQSLVSAVGLRLRGKLDARADGDRQAVLSTPLGIGPFVEAAFFHRASRSLLVTDIVVAVPREPPAICISNPAPLLVRAKPRSASPPEVRLPLDLGHAAGPGVACGRALAASARPRPRLLWRAGQHGRGAATRLVENHLVCALLPAVLRPFLAAVGLYLDRRVRRVARSPSPPRLPYPAPRLSCSANSAATRRADGRSLFCAWQLPSCWCRPSCRRALPCSAPLPLPLHQCASLCTLCRRRQVRVA